MSRPEGDSENTVKTSEESAELLVNSGQVATWAATDNADVPSGPAELGTLRCVGSGRLTGRAQKFCNFLKDPAGRCVFLIERNYQRSLRGSPSRSAADTPRQRAMATNSMSETLRRPCSMSEIVSWLSGAPEREAQRARSVWEIRGRFDKRSRRIRSPVKFLRFSLVLSKLHQYSTAFTGLLQNHILQLDAARPPL